jgi:hypothetical protein
MGTINSGPVGSVKEMGSQSLCAGCVGCVRNVAANLMDLLHLQHPLLAAGLGWQAVDGSLHD